MAFGEKGIREMMKTAKRAWASMFHLSAAAKDADGWTRAIVHIFALCLAAGAFHAAASAGRRMIPSIAETRLAEIAGDMIWHFLLIHALFSPAVYGLTFRLRAARGFAGTLTAVVMYAPIFGLALTAIFASPVALDEGVGAAFAYPLSGNWVGAMLIAGLIASAAFSLWQRKDGETPAPPPAITASRFYAPIEAAVCISALAFMLLMLSMARL